MKNLYEIRGPITVIFIDSKRHGRKECLIDTDKLDSVRKIKGSWRIDEIPRHRTLYARAEVFNGYEVFLQRIHRLVTNAPSGMLVDHIDGNGLNNTVSNLRIVTNAQNLQNRIGNDRNNSSGYRGVYWCKRKSRWHARVKINGKCIHLGYFYDKDEAGHIAREARKRYMPFSTN